MAGGLGLAAVAALWRLAEAWASAPDRTNAYTFVAAIGGVVVFEFLRFGVTVKSRHRRTVEDQFRLRDVRAEQVKDLLNQVDASRQALQAVEAAIELRVRQRSLLRRRERVNHALDEVTAELEAIRTEERLLGDAADGLHLTKDAAHRLNEALARLEPAKGTSRHTVLELTIGGLPLGLGRITLAAFDLVEDWQERRRVARVAEAAGDSSEECDGTSTTRGS